MQKYGYTAKNILIFLFVLLGIWGLIDLANKAAAYIDRVFTPEPTQEFFVVHYAFKEGIDHNTGWYVFAQSYGETKPEAPKTEFYGPNDIIAMSNQSREIIRAGYVGIEVKGPAGTQGQIASYSGATDSLFGIEKLVVPFWDGKLYVNADCDQSDFWFDQDKNGLMYGGGWFICHRNSLK